MEMDPLTAAHASGAPEHAKICNNFVYDNHISLINEMMPRSNDFCDENVG